MSVTTGPMRFKGDETGVFVSHEDAKRLLKEVDQGYMREILCVLASADSERRTDDYAHVKAMLPFGDAVAPLTPGDNPGPRIGEVWSSWTGNRTHRIGTVSSTDPNWGFGVCGVDIRSNLRGVKKVYEEASCLRC